ncbi:MAG: efflux RND transporter permease subunit [Rikenellaceae bacterium]|nr:efflux RND transporter permease subunit [Rikenellaceae bacterium]
MKNTFDVIGWAMRNYKITYLVIGLFMVFGIYSLTVMPKQEFPDFTIRQGLIVAVYPGANSSQIEEQVAKPLERFLFTYHEIDRKKTYSMSRNGILYVMVELNENVNNKDEVWSKIKHGLQLFKQQLPTGVVALIANDDFGDTSALLITLESDSRSYRDLEYLLEELEDKLRTIESVSNLRRYGLQKEQISIYIDREQLTAYGIDHKTLFSNLFGQGFTTVSGTIENDEFEIPLYIKPVYESEYQIADQIIYSDPADKIIRLKDVARIIREYDAPDSYILNNGCRAVVLSMEMRTGYNIVDYGKSVDKILNEFISTLPPDVSVKRIADQPKVVEDSVRGFLRDLLISIIVVIVSMMFLFPLRSAVVAATTIPITIMITIGIMYFFGIPLNTVTLAALIVVLGMIVDNSVVVVDAYLEYLDRGWSRWHAAMASAKNYSRSIFLATFCICLIFFPLLATFTGIWLDFLQSFPWTFTIALMISFAIAMIYIPFMEYLIINKGLKNNFVEAQKKLNWIDTVQNGYYSILKWTFRYPGLTIGLGIVFIVISILGFFKLDIRMLPFADREQFAVEIHLPEGSTLDQTADVADSLYSLLEKDDRITSITSFIGTSSPRFQATYAPKIAGKNYAQFIVNTTGKKETICILEEYADKYADYYPNAYVNFKQLDYQVADFPIEVRFTGNSIEELKKIADLLILLCREIDELVWVHHNFEELLPSANVNLNTVEASRLGINRSVAEVELASIYGNVQTGTVWEGDYPVSIVLKSEKNKDENRLDKIGANYVSTIIPGKSVPLRQIAEIEPAWNEGQIVRRNSMRTISVVANVKRGYNELKAQSKVRNILEREIVPDLPAGITYQYGGMVENDAEIISPILIGICMALFLIFIILIFNFKKISVALAALLSILLCIPGAVGGMWITDTVFGITGVLGVVSLIGIVVRNVIIIFDHAEELRTKKKLSAKEAAFDAGSRRMVPIFLTSVTTAVGVIPMILSGSFLWAPMGIVIFFGTIAAMVMVVTMLPVIYWKIFDKAKTLINGYE